MNLRILFTTPVLEHPPAGGPQLRIENSIKALHRIAELHVVSRLDRESIGGEQAVDFYSGYCESLTFAPSASRGFFGNRYVRKAQRIARKFGGRAVTADAEYLLGLVRRTGADAIWCGYGNISFDLIQKLKAAQPQLPVICDTDSVWSRFVLRELPYEKNHFRREWIRIKGRRKEAEERAWVNLCDVTTAVSEIDAAYYRSIASDPERVHIFSNVIDLARYAEAPQPPEGLKKPCMYLAGTFGHSNSPMDRAAQWVLEEVLPRVQSVIPDMHFYIVGKDSERTLAHVRNPAVTVTGKLPSVLPYLCHADVALVPLQFESGTRFKIMEAAACRIPIVSTALGAEGIPVTHGKDILLADEPQAFADAICCLIKSPERAAAIAAAAYELVHANYSISALEKEAREILGYVLEA